VIAPYPYSEEAWRFIWERIAIDASGCWIWTGGTMGGCYPGTLFGGLVYRPHRMIWELVNKRPFPAGSIARHFCDCTRCVRHIVPGTHKENHDDRCRIFGGRLKRPADENAVQSRIARDLASREWPDISQIPTEYAALSYFGETA
jgi:hypothetical protein